jgi:TPR repeat protein
MEAVRLTNGKEYSSVEKNDITNLIETLCEVTPDGTAEASNGLQALRREAARALFDLSAADEDDDRLTAVLATLLSSSGTEAARQAFVNRATGSAAVRLEAESALAFVEAVEQSTEVAPAHLVEELASAVASPVGGATLWSRIADGFRPAQRWRVVAACVVVLVASGASLSLYRETQDRVTNPPASVVELDRLDRNLGSGDRLANTDTKEALERAELASMAAAAGAAANGDKRVGTTQTGRKPVQAEARPAGAFDGAPVNQDTAIPVAGAAAASKKAIPPSATDSSLTSLQYAAEGGHPVAQWKLGRMYADGDGVVQDDLRAFEYFSRIANAHAEDSPSAPQAAIVANAFVALGRYYLNGIPNSKITADPERARETFSHAAVYFGNADAQYELARLYLKNAGSSRDDFRYGARWLGLAAQKGQHQAQALLGQMLFNGDQLPRQAARGLMWLTLARDSATADETWIRDSYNKAIAKASEDDRAMALQMLEHWVQGRKD